MGEHFSPTPEDITSTEKEGFADPEAQAHAEAIANDLPRFQEYRTEIAKRMEKINTNLRSAMSFDKDKQLADRETLFNELQMIDNKITELSSESRALSDEENREQDFITQSRERLGLPIVDDNTSTTTPEPTQAEEGSEGTTE